MQQPESSSISGSAHRIFDADTYLAKPHNLWVSRAPAQYRDRVPQVKPVVGVPCWIFNGDTLIESGANPASAVLPYGGNARDFVQFTRLTSPHSLEQGKTAT